MIEMRFPTKTERIILSIFLITLSLLFSSCKKDSRPPKLVIGQDFYYWESDADATYGDAMKNARNFKKLDDYSENNLMKILGREPHYVWVRAEFEIPEMFKNQPLGMVIPHLRFAEQVFCNGTFISQYGAFPPHEQSTLFKAHFFSFPLDILEQNGKNIVLIRIFTQGASGISSHAFIWPTRFAYPAFEKINFNHTRIYMLMFGIMLFTGILYASLYMNLKEFKEFRTFAALNFVTLIFISYFFATEIPFYTDGHIPHLLFTKFTLCIPAYLILYFTPKFTSEYYGSISPKPISFISHATVILQTTLTLLAPSYTFLLKIYPLMIFLIIVQIVNGAVDFAINVRNKKTRKQAIEVIIGFIPAFISGILDVGLRLHDNTTAYPYFVIFGWQFSIVLFIALLGRRFGLMYKKNLQLSEHLMEEVDIRTQDLKDANLALSMLNERLERDKHRSDMDLEMASVVQRKFLPRPNRQFRRWEISVCYLPQSKVSGDFYDYYSYNDTLNGVTLFDVSGHGLSASLVTMLSKNIISRAFQTGFRRRENVKYILNKINNQIIKEKGSIENYMTGILCRFEPASDKQTCEVELCNAGHPYPLLFNAKTNEVKELKGNDGAKHYGAIGMKGIMVSFAQSNFVMETDDMLIFYTDGLTEASNSRQEQFGIEKIKEIIKECHERETNEIIERILKDVDEFSEHRGFDDDITIIIAKRTDGSKYVEGEYADEDNLEADDDEQQYEELEAVD